jgi:hypothetical protein
VRSGILTLTRRQAAIKLENIKRATYYFQHFGGTVYKKEVPVADVLKTFVADPKVLLRIDSETSEHRVTLIDRKDFQVGYVVEF